MMGCWSDGVTELQKGGGPCSVIAAIKKIGRDGARPSI